MFYYIVFLTNTLLIEIYKIIGEILKNIISLIYIFWIFNNFNERERISLKMNNNNNNNNNNMLPTRLILITSQLI